NEIDWNWQSLLDPEAGEWRLAAILTDLAWLLRAYSQSVSSDGAQHGEKTS
ncbi:hypothetical protein, partial [Pseudomonas aeruginosa]|uniref:hypothetical protein n=1 Tax=Pseudomonas aeruginosa TaxID=287 RepID=UPI0015C528BC